MPDFDADHDFRVRTAVFAFLDKAVRRHGEVLPRSLLAEGLTYQGVRVPLLGPQGIFKPRVLELPISLTTAPNGPYNDAFNDVGQLQYRYRGIDPMHPDNVRVREAARRHLPLVYFHGALPGRYLAVWPVYVVGDDPGQLTFTVEGDAGVPLGAVDDAAFDAPDERAKRRYATRLVTQRLHQATFRERVLAAYSRQCAFCRFKHPELLDAAHIIPDADPTGEPVVPNGLSLCKIHHGAYDRGFLGVTPDYGIAVRPDLLDEEDGPTLKHSIQGLQGARLVVPRTRAHRPDPERLAVRYEQFLESA